MILTNQHMMICVDHVHMEEIHNSLEELAQSPLFSLRMRGDSFLSHSICIHKNYGKGIVYLNDDLYIHPLTIYVQDVSPRRSLLLPSNLSPSLQSPSHQLEGRFCDQQAVSCLANTIIASLSMRSTFLLLIIS